MAANFFVLCLKSQSMYMRRFVLQHLLLMKKPTGQTLMNWDCLFLPHHANSFVNSPKGAVFRPSFAPYKCTLRQKPTFCPEIPLILIFQKCEYCAKMRFQKCEFCENWDFRNVNFVKNVILERCILQKLVFSICEFLDKIWILPQCEMPPL